MVDLRNCSPPGKHWVKFRGRVIGSPLLGPLIDTACATLEARFSKGVTATQVMDLRTSLAFSTISLLLFGIGCRNSRDLARPTLDVQEVRTADHSLLTGEVYFLGASLLGYDSMCFGPLARRIIEYRDPKDMMVLKQALESHTECGRVRVTHGSLEMRLCDFGILIAEEIVPFDSPSGHSFGPSTAYEFRDDARRFLLKKLFSAETVPEKCEYLYFDAAGNDISDKVRQRGFGP